MVRRAGMLVVTLPTYQFVLYGIHRFALPGWWVDYVAADGRLSPIVSAIPAVVAVGVAGIVALLAWCAFAGADA